MDVLREVEKAEAGCTYQNSQLNEGSERENEIMTNQRIIVSRSKAYSKSKRRMRVAGWNMEVKPMQSLFSSF